MNEIDLVDKAYETGYKDGYDAAKKEYEEKLVELEKKLKQAQARYYQVFR